MRFKAFGPGMLYCLMALLLTGAASAAWAQEHGGSNRPVRYGVPASMAGKPWTFAGETIPLQRPDVQYRINCQINFLLMDARSVLTTWLDEKARYNWLFEETFAREGIPKEFSLLAPVLSALKGRPGQKGPAVGWWVLSEGCSSGDGADSGQDSWHDDRMDLDLSTRCFASKIKEIRKDLGSQGWLLPALAYVTSAKTVKDLKEKWDTDVFWDLPVPDNADELIVRWIAFAIIDANRAAYGLKTPDVVPVTFDQVSGLILAKDLPVAEIARMLGVPPREILRLNPKIKVAQPFLPATVKGKPQPHTIATPKGKGQLLLNKLKETGYLAQQQHR